MNNIYDYREAELTIFGLYGVDEKGNCECGNHECKALFKHPRASNWQATPFYSDEQIQVMQDVGHLATGFGVLVKNIIVVDVDARNGGLESYDKLCLDLNIDLEEASGFVVETGSADGSKHIYFKAPVPPVALAQSLPKYKGVDFKSSGFVVGEGSLHKSGNRYETKKGYPQDITEPPQALIELLQKKNQFRSTDELGQTVDIEDEELRKMVMHISGGDGYHKWIDVGMALHDTTSGSLQGLTIWDEWSQLYDGYESGVTATKWNTFGKGQSLVSLGTLMHFAKQDGYIEPVVFNADEYIKHEKNTLDTSHIDIRKPHGFVGTLCQWINSQCLYPRENLAVAASLYIISCIAGMRTIDVDFGINANLMAFGVAGSGSGKEAIYKATLECLRVAGVMPAVHGKFKSEQESIRNLLRHQGSFYTIDEMGIELTKISNASKRGGAAYMEGLIGLIMSAYSKADGVLPISGDMKEDIKESLKAELSRVYKKMDDDGEEKHKQAELRLLKQLSEADEGIVNPYVALLGTTTPSTFYGLIDEEMATNGFIARTAIFKEKEDNPRWKDNFKRPPMDMHLQLALAALYNGGDQDNDCPRVCKRGSEIAVTTTQEAKEALYEIREYFHSLAESQKETKNLIPIPRRGFEMVLKISLILAIPTGVRTLQDVLYAFEVAKSDVDFKIELANSNRDHKNKDEAGNVLLSSILTKLDKDIAVTIGQVRNRIRNFNKEQVDEGVEHLVKTGKVRKIEEMNEKNRKVTVKLILA